MALSQFICGIYLREQNAMQDLFLCRILFCVVSFPCSSSVFITSS